MPTFLISAADRTGKVRKKRLTAPDERSLERKLEQSGEYLVSVLKEERKETAPRGLSSRIGRDDRIDMAFQLSVMCASGVPLLTAIGDFAEKRASAPLRRVLNVVLRDMREGMLLSEALERHPKAFDRIFIHLVKAGEASGSLDLVMERSYKEMEWQSRIRGRLIQALVYPAFLLAAIAGLVVLLLTFLLPKVMDILPLAGGNLPLPTRILIGASNLITDQWIVLAAAAAALPLSIQVARLFERGRYITDFLLMKTPPIGGVVLDVAVGRFISTFRTLITSGVEVIQALNISGGASGNAVIAARTRGIVDRIVGGAMLSEAFGTVREFDSLIQSMISMSEKTGKTGEALERISQYYDTTIPRKVKRLISILEPGIIAAAGVIVGFVLVGTLLPLFNLYTAF